MDPATRHRHRIVVALDLSEYAAIVLEHAIDQAARHDAPDLHFIHVVGAHADVSEAKARLADLVLPLLSELASVDWRARLHVRGGPAEETICDPAAEVCADLIVVGRFGVHGGRALGAIASRVLARASCPTLVVGLAEDTTPSVAVCEACAAVREESDGEQWFCQRHRAEDRASLASVFVPGPIWTGGGLLW
jgi:nucleotide-binding universal stress UspA family protein